ncbi:MAG: hypothetical protein WCG27_07650, partial [Pseudomonadota bacterium]
MQEILEGLKKEDPAFSFLKSYEGVSDKTPSINKSEVGRSFYNLGKVHYDKSDLSRAEEYFLRALNCLERPQDSNFILKTMGFLIRVASEKLEDSKAQKYIALSEKLVDELSRELPTLTSEYFYNVGVVHTYKGQFTEAQNNFLFSYKKSKEENDPETLAKSLLAMATNSYYNREFDRALEYIQQLDELLKIINKHYLLGSMFLCAGRIYIELGLYEQAMVSLRRANKILQEKKSWNLYGYLLLSRGIIYKLMGEFNNALIFFHLAIDST